MQQNGCEDGGGSQKRAGAAFAEHKPKKHWDSASNRKSDAVGEQHGDATAVGEQHGDGYLKRPMTVSIMNARLRERMIVQYRIIRPIYKKIRSNEESMGERGRRIGARWRRKQTSLAPMRRKNM